MVPTFIGFGAAFIIGSLLVVIAGAGSQFVGCPAVVAEIPAREAACDWFSGFVILGGVLAVIGGGVASGILVFGKISA